MKVISLLFLIAISLVLVTNLEYRQSQRSLKTDLQIQRMTYSYDQAYLGCQTNDSVLIFNGVTLDLVQTLQKPKVIYLSFNFQSNLLALAYSTKSIQIYARNPNKDYQFFTTPMQTIQADPDYPILDLKFSKSSNYLAVAQNSNVSIYNIIPKQTSTQPIKTITNDLTLNDQIYLKWLNQDAPAFLILFQEKITSISWQQTTENLLVAGTDTKLTLFGPKQGYNDVLFSFQSGTQNYIDMCQNGIFVAVSNRTMRIFKTDGSKVFEKAISYDMQQVYCSGNAKYIMALTNDQNIFMIWYQQNDAFWFDEISGFNGISLVLSPIGSDSIWLSFKQSGNQYSLCIQDGTYYNPTFDRCDACKQQCSLCHQESTTCFSCKNRFYLVNNKCSRCSMGCNSCSYQNVCDECINGPHIVKNGDVCSCNGGGIFIEDVCYCKNGFYYDIETCTSCVEGCLTCETKDKCGDCASGYQHRSGDQICHKIDNGGNDGISTVAIVFIIIGCLVAVALIVVAVICIRRKRQQRQETALLIKSGEDIRDDY